MSSEGIEHMAHIEGEEGFFLGAAKETNIEIPESQVEVKKTTISLINGLALLQTILGIAIFTILVITEFGPDSKCLIRTENGKLSDKCYCEEFGGKIRELSNTLSSFAFVIVAFAILYRISKEENQKSKFVICSAIYAYTVLWLGIGSASFHGTMKEIGGVMDAGTMLLWIVAALTLILSPLSFFKVRGMILIFGGVSFLAILITILTPFDHVTFGVLVAVTIFSELVMGILKFDATIRVLEKETLDHNTPNKIFSKYVELHINATALQDFQSRVCKGVHLHERSSTYIRCFLKYLLKYYQKFFTGLVLFLSGYFVWINSRTNSVLCIPNSIFQGHAYWHLADATASYLLFLHLSRFTN